MTDRGARSDPDPEREREIASIKRWLRVADEFVRRRNGKKGGERSLPGERPRSDREGDDDRGLVVR